MEPEPFKLQLQIFCRNDDCCIEQVKKLLLSSASRRDAAARERESVRKERESIVSDRAHSKPENRETQTDGRTGGRKKERPLLPSPATFSDTRLEPSLQGGGGGGGGRGGEKFAFTPTEQISKHLRANMDLGGDE